ncbi:hypothetical protein A2U01_0098811, partial [Trifolium medium]|nr:hypothetical protein [Trifolium medium]
PDARETQLVRDTAAVMRLLETTLVLNSEETCPVAEMKKLQAKNEKLRGELTRVENASRTTGRSMKSKWGWSVSSGK